MVKEQLIVYEDDHTMVLNKPQDLRMDGNHAATVEKLLQYLVPTFFHYPTHQLDYATSGLLLYARDQESAATICGCFEKRTVKKEYVAVVRGHLHLQNCQFPCLPSESLKDWRNGSVEKRYKNRKEKKLVSIPLHAVFHEWQVHQRQGKRKGYTLNLSLEDQEELLSLTWKQVKYHADYERWKCALEGLRNEKNNKEQNAQKAQASPIPPVFSVETENDSFYINVSLAKGLHREFGMYVSPFEVKDLACGTNYCHPSKKDLDYKPSFTHVKILSRGIYNHYPVTKVKLIPWTGRRHQLRMHMAVLGYPVLGDATYGVNNREREDCQRMCLHAWSLELELPSGMKKFIAEDPFEVQEGSVSIANTVD